jgi:hypothetical protein
MKVRSQEELLRQLDRQSSRRKRELIMLRESLETSEGDRQTLNARTSIVMAYAHWEGFVKDAAQAYLIYVANSTRPFCDFTLPFQAIACRREILSASRATKKIQPHIDVVRRVFDKAEEIVSIPSSRIIDTESNLNGEVFKNIYKTVGLQNIENWGRGKLAKMGDICKDRCDIAHGQLVQPRPNVAREALDFVLDSIDQFSSDVKDAALEQSHLRATE